MSRTEYKLEIIMYERKVDMDSNIEDSAELLEEDELLGPNMFDTYEEALARYEMFMTDAVSGESERGQALEQVRDYIQYCYEDMKDDSSGHPDLLLGLSRVLSMINQQE